MRDSEWLEVRCCCVPKKLLGWLEAPLNARNIALAAVIAPGASFGVIENIASTEVHTNYVLPIQLIEVDGLKYRAIKAEGVTEEQLKRFSGFRPNEYGC